VAGIRHRRAQHGLSCRANEKGLDLDAAFGVNKPASCAATLSTHQGHAGDREIEPLGAEKA
jgi:hypothetical protein